MNKIGQSLIGAAGFGVALASSQAHATLTCTNTFPLPNGGGFPQTALGGGLCVQAGDKLFGNFNFSTLPGQGEEFGSVDFGVPSSTVGSYTVTLVLAPFRPIPPSRASVSRYK